MKYTCDKECLFNVFLINHINTNDKLEHLKTVKDCPGRTFCFHFEKKVFLFLMSFERTLATCAYSSPLQTIFNLSIFRVISLKTKLNRISSTKVIDIFIFIRKSNRQFYIRGFVGGDYLPVKITSLYRQSFSPYSVIYLKSVFRKR